MSHCGNVCGTKDKNTQNKKHNTNIKNHGTPTYNNRQQIDKTIKKNWGDDPWFLFSNKKWKDKCDKLLKEKRIVYTEEELKNINEKRRKTIEQKTKEEREKSVKKQQDTMLKKHGGKTTMESPKLKNKVYKTKTKKYKNKYYTNPKKAKDTLIKTKGITCGCQSVNENGIKKTIITNNKKYGCNYPQQNPDWYNNHKGFVHYMYNDICFDSSWELVFYIWLVDHNIRFEYHPAPFDYYWSENISYHKYYPDFKLWNNTYIEFKRPDLYKNMITFNGSKENAKYLCMVKNNVIIYTQCEKYEKYIEDKYGKNYIKQFKNTKNKDR